MKTKIYILTTVEVVDGCTDTFETLAYGTEAEAREQFERVVADLRKVYKNSGYVEDGEDSDHCFEIYEEGYYAHNHASVTIRETDINLPEPQRGVLVVPPSGMEEVIDVRLDETTFPAAYKEKMDELREQGAFDGDGEACTWLRQNPIVLELIYEKHHGLFAVESGALGSGCVRSPYTGADVVAPEN